MSKIKLLFADNLEPISSDYSNPLRYYLNITQSTEQGIRIIAVTDSEYYSENTVINISASSTKLQLAPDVSGSAGTYQAAGTSLDLGTVESSYTYFWAKSVTVVGDVIENDTTVSIEIAGEIFAEYNPPEDTWANTMLASYKTLNPEQADWMDSTPEGTAVENTFHNRLEPGGYLHTTFGPNGQNKTECDFVLLFASIAEQTSEQNNVKEGVVLRWDINGVVFTQTNTPSHNINSDGIITVSSTDGFSGVEEFRVNSNGLIGRPPRFNGFSGLRMFRISENAFSGNLPVWGFGELDSFSIGNNNFTGTLPNTHLTNAYGVWAFNNLFTGVGAIAPTSIMHDGYFRLDGNDISSLETLLQALYDNRASFTYHSPGLNMTGNAEALPLGKSPEQAYTDGDVGTGKYNMWVLMTDPNSEGFNTWNFIPNYVTPEVELTIEVKDGSNQPIEGVSIQIS